jgi:CHASE1-domain containing sensor protein
VLALVLFLLARARVRLRELVQLLAADARGERDAAEARRLEVLGRVWVLLAPFGAVFGLEAADEFALVVGLELVVVVAGRGIVSITVGWVG